MDNYDTKYINIKQNNSVIPYDLNISSILPNIFDDYSINDISFLNNENKMKREKINKYLNNNNVFYTVIYKTYQSNKVVDIFFLLKKVDNEYKFIENIKEIYNINYKIRNDLLNYTTIIYNDILVKILIINNLEHDLENNGYGWASLYEICNLNKLNDINIETQFINFINTNISYIK